MCGICGFNWDDRGLLKRMNGAIYHRGPDEEGYYIDRKVSLGARRLSIIDLSTGKQPIFNEDKSVCVVFNGEIYNFQALRQELEKKGHKFYTKADTEVIVHSYEEYGDDCVKSLNGMFGFALWDSSKKKILLVVDRLGIKPLYYTYFEGKLLFASEIKAILKYHEVRRAVNRKALADYLTFRYTPSEQTMFDGIMKLAPGHLMIYQNKQIKISKYWDLDINKETNKPERYYSEKIVEILKESVRMQMISDVPLGIYLSGGLDSSIVTAFMKTFTDSDIKTFSVAFEAEEPFNESRYSRLMAEHYGTDHHELIVKSDSIKYLPSAIWHLDDLDNDPTILAQYLLSEFTKKEVTVVLTGEGADELFGGYDEFKFMTLAERYKNLAPRFLLKSAVKCIKMLPNEFLNNFFTFASSLGEKGKERLYHFVDNLKNKEESYMTLTSFFSDDEKKEIYSKELYTFEQESNDYSQQISPYFYGCTKKNILNKLIYLDIKRRLPYHLLHKMDKMTMAHSIEARVPFLNHNLAEFSFQIPTRLKLNGLEQKYILKKAVSGLMPKEILKRKKHPFVVPMDVWFRQSLKEAAEAILSKSSICKGRYFNQDAIRKIIRNYEKSSLYYGRQLWGIISFDIWHRIYIENENIEKPKNIFQLYS
ncbi:asparagine synthase (glutamine-hydrolyzing) [Candidatus Woesearchaeota archaeon]|nr:asparagine synthase (glutamine-hydrolyzing) [Candidatus Woesearchaeota archaeon]